MVSGLLLLVPAIRPTVGVGAVVAVSGGDAAVAGGIVAGVYANSA
jgi:hypothetical protein